MMAAVCPVKQNCLLNLGTLYLGKDVERISVPDELHIPIESETPGLLAFNLSISH